MSDYSSIIEYDKKGRTVRVEVYEPAIIINYEYNNDVRIYTSKSPDNSSNHLETITQKKINKEYIDIEKYQEGDVYDVMTRYDEFGNEIYLTRLNKKTSSIYRKKTIRNKCGIAKIWFEEYNKIINMGFKVDIKKLLKKTC
jgi:hypothetical protein